MSKPDQFKVQAPDWREALRKNQANTRNVIILFIIIYFSVGFLIDVYFYAGQYYTGNFGQYVNDQFNSATVYHVQPSVPYAQILHDLVTFKIFPLATIAMLGVAIVSLIIAYLFHNRLVMLGTDYNEITEDTAKTLEERQLFNVMEELKIAAGLRFMPKVFIIEADYMNAFASGFSEESAMVAITRGLLQKLDREELQAVMAHELSHIRHDDIRLTLTVALLSNLILIAIDLLFRGVIYGRGRRDNQLIIIIVIARFLLPILTVLLMLYLSRTRELMADSGSVELTRSNEPLARALIKIHTDHTNNHDQYQRAYAATAHEQVRQAAYVYDPHYAGISMVSSINNLFSTHPPLEERLKALGVEMPNIKT